MSSLRTNALCLLVFCALGASAQTLTVGNAFVPKSPYTGPVAGRTFIDVTHPATANGTITSAAFAMGTFEASCSDVAKIRFFRRQGNMLLVIAERGPFTWVSDTELFAISPPVQLLAGDMIGITLEPNQVCGHPIVMTTGGEYLAFPDDVSGTVPVSAGTTKAGLLAVTGVGEASDEYTAAIVPVVGSATGAYGSQWRTSLQLLNPHSAPVAGHLVFRAARAPASSSDPSVPYSLEGGATLMIADVMAAIGRSGIGSLDVTKRGTAAGGVTPVVVAYIVSDQGNGSAVGLAEQAIDVNDLSQQCPTPAGVIMASHVLQAGDTGYLLAPSDQVGSRFNIGMRSLGAGATVVITVKYATGGAGPTSTIEYPPNTFEQVTAEEFLGTRLSGGESIAITVSRGSAIVYGTTTNNVSNDPAMQFAHSVLREK